MLQLTNDTFGNASGKDAQFESEDELRSFVHDIATQCGWYDEYRSRERDAAHHIGLPEPVDGVDMMTLKQYEQDLFKRAMRCAVVV